VRANLGEALRKNWRSSEPQKLEGFEGTTERLIRGRRQQRRGRLEESMRPLRYPSQNKLLGVSPSFSDLRKKQ